MRSERLAICVSDADILVKLCRTGYLDLLEKLFAKVVIPGRVHMEAQKKIGTHSRGASMAAAVQVGWLEVILLNDRTRFDAIQVNSTRTFCGNFEDLLGPGELEAAALAHELDIRWLLSDDRAAKDYIEECTDIIGLSHHEILALCCLENILSEQQAREVFEAIGATRTHPVGVPFEELMRRARKRFRELELL
jgi:predicted nucleic acid-binding protein